MKKFLFQFLLFLIPFYFVGLFIGVVYYVGCETGEFDDFDRLIEVQRQDHSVFIGMGYNEQNAYYKLKNANYYQADVISLGTSRVMQFKNDYFSVNFYNCGGAVSWNYDEYLNFLKNLNYTPKIIILGLDQWVFNDAWNQSCIVYKNYRPIELIDRNSIAMEWEMIQDFIYHRWNFYSIRNYPMNYGFNGKMKDTGFEWDGSYYYGDIYRNPETQRDYMFVNTFDRIEGGYNRFEWGEHVDEETCAYLIAFLEYCKENEIEVIGFAPPFAPSVYDKMLVSGNYGYLNEMNCRCEELFEEYGYSYFDYTDVSRLGISNSYFIDGFHGSEVAYAYMVDDMMIQGSSLQRFVNKKELDNLLDNRYSDLILCDYIHKRTGDYTAGEYSD